MFYGSPFVPYNTGNCTVFLRSDAAATITFAVRFCVATIQGWHLFGKPAAINDT